MDIAVTHVSADRFAIQVRGGQDAGPTPTELFAASLAACVGFYAGTACRPTGCGSTATPP
jgi:putative redox protein